MESRDNLFFECSYSAEVWSKLMQGLLQNSFTTLWLELMVLVMDTNGGLLERFLTRYTLQVIVSFLWRKRNERRHGAWWYTHIGRSPGEVIDRQFRNRCFSLRQIGDLKYMRALTLWLAFKVNVSVYFKSYLDCKSISNADTDGWITKANFFNYFISFFSL